MFFGGFGFLLLNRLVIEGDIRKALRNRAKRRR
jgi:hypothetical protein